MGSISLPYGVRLLYEDGLCPPDSVRADLTNASPAQLQKLASESLTLQTTATLLVISDSTIDTADLSSHAAAQIDAAMTAQIPDSGGPSADLPDAAGTVNTINLLA
ncbi:MAG: hypothetical protein JO033_10205 [Acidobacteriaceae bacterium]|nr:hypothetical protein [Acidobacteriaceae bacterium]